MPVDVLDNGSVTGRIYRCLVERPRSAVRDVVRCTDLPEEAVRSGLARLAECDAVLPVGDPDEERWEAQPPESVVETHIRIEQERFAMLRETGDSLTRVYRVARRTGPAHDGWDVLHDDERTVAQLRQLQRTAQQEVLVISAPPWLPEDHGSEAQVTLRTRRMAAGVRYRTIYHSSVLADADQVDTALRCMALGEQGRVLHAPLIKLLISDRERALLPLDPDRAVDGASMVVHRSSLLDALVNVFETLWQLAVPLSSVDVVEPIETRDRELLTLMAAGFTDETIARRLRLSRRSVVRRTGALLERLGASTRFQAGVQAVRRRWL